MEILSNLKQLKTAHDFSLNTWFLFSVLYEFQVCALTEGFFVFCFFQ